MRSEGFVTEDGLRQGGGLSHVLFIVFMDDIVKQWIDGIYPEYGVDYSGLLDRFHVGSLTDRRSEASGKLLINLINNHIDAPELLAHIDVAVSEYGTRTCVTFQVPRVRSNMLEKAPVGHMTKNTNARYPDPFSIRGSTPSV
ncbi:hypothetical protein Trydic_g1893 [Trypoxylus dichotomus]